ncbi:hypothetical protein J3R82DRAFT_10827 [Butyriboletus roseoflavus]|nr:hypothetical protein J3R82DRAFT_10827 [Butyriboletus roseoflavus]
MSGLAQHIVDPRVLADELDASPPSSHLDIYSGLDNYVFGSSSLPPHDAPESISPLTPIAHLLSPDRTPRPSVSGEPASPPFHNVSSHPSQGAGRPASSLYPSAFQPRRRSATRDPMLIDSSRPSSRAVFRFDTEKSQDPTPSMDPITAALFSPHRAELMSDNASQHTFGRASRAHGVAAATSQDGEAPSSSSVSISTSRSSSRTSMRSTEQFSSDDELEIDYYDDGNSSPLTFARNHLVDINENVDPDDPGPSTIRSSVFDGRRVARIAYSPYVAPVEAGMPPVPAVRQIAEKTQQSFLPKSEPLSRADWLSLEAQLQAKQQQAAQHNVYDGLDLQYILPTHTEGSIRSFSSRLSFVHGPAGPRRSSPLPSVLALGPGSTTTLPIEDSFLRHIQKNDRAFDVLRYYWSFQREKADGSNSSLRRRQKAHHHRTDKPVKEIPSRVQEMWRCGHVGRFKVDRLVLKPQSADPTKGAQQRIHVRHIPDPFLLGNTTTGPHSVIHKHSRAVAFSIFRSHALFSGRYAGGTGAGPSSVQTHMNMRFGIMLAPKKLSTYGLLDTESRGPRDKERDRGSRRGTQSLSFRERDSRGKERRREQDKEDRGKGKTKAPNKGKGKEKSDKKHRVNPTESAESSTATSSAGSVTNSTVQYVVSALERPMIKIQLSPSVSSSTTAYRFDSTSRPVSPTSLLSQSINNSTKIPESETFSISSTRHHHDHRDSLDPDDRLPARTTHAEAFSALDPNDIENLRAKATGRANAESGSTFAGRLFRVFRGSSRADDHSSSTTQPRAFQPPWLITAGRDQQEENDRVLNDLNASFRDVGLLHTNPHKSSKAASKRKSSQGILDQIPDDCLYMLLPLWPGETDTATVHADTSSTASFATTSENRQYLLVYYVPFGEAASKDKKPEKKRAKHSHSSDSGPESDPKAVYLPAFRAVARVITYDELRLSGVRVPSDGLAINGPEWEAISYPVPPPLHDAQMIDTVVCPMSWSGAWV